MPSSSSKASRTSRRTRTILLLLILGWELNAAARDTVSASAPTPDAPAESIRSAVVPDESGDVAAEVKQAAAPVPSPPLTHYAALWQRSMFTSRALPAPEAPQGPGFADQLVLAGVYEVDGAVVAVILDKMTAQISEARIGSDNEQGIRVKSVEPAGESGPGRVQLQKGMQTGWIQFADAGAASATSANAAAPPEAPVQLLTPGAAAAADMNTVPRVAVPMDMAPAAPMVQPMPEIANPPLPSSPNPSLDEIPLPPE